MSNEQKFLSIGSNQVRLGDIVDFNPKLEGVLRDDDRVGFITMSDVSNNAKVLAIQERYFSDVKKGFTYFQPGDVLLAKITPCMENGKGCLCPPRYKHFFGSTEFHVLRVKKDRVLPDYIYYITNQDSFRKLAARNMKGSAGQKRVPRDFLENYPLTLPSIERQRKASEILSVVDVEIQKTEDVISSMGKLRGGLMHDLFTKGVRHRFFKKTRIGNIPEQWDVKKLGEVLQFSQYGLSRASNKGGVYPMFRMNNIIGGKMVAEPMTYIDLLSEEADKYLLKKGDILVNRTNSIDLVGKTGIFELEGDFVFASYLVRLRVNESVVLPAFLNYFLNSGSVQNLLRNLATKGVSQANINPTKLKTRLDCVIPPLTEQAEIVHILGCVDHKLELEKLMLSSLNKLKKGLMRDLLSENKIISI